MAKKDALFAYRLLDNQSMAANFESASFKARYLDNLIVNISATSISDNAGEFKIWHRIIKEDTSQYSDWVALDFGESISLSGDASDLLLIRINQISPGELKVSFTASGTSPAGSCDIWISGTSIGG